MIAINVPIFKRKEIIYRKYCKERSNNVVGITRSPQTAHALYLPQSQSRP